MVITVVTTTIYANSAEKRLGILDLLLFYYAIHIKNNKSIDYLTTRPLSRECGFAHVLLSPTFKRFIQSVDFIGLFHLFQM